MQVMIERTNELLASGEVTVEAVSAQTQQLAQQNMKDIEGDKQKSSSRDKEPEKSATPVVDYQIMTHRSLDDEKKEGAKSELKDRKTQAQQDRPESVHVRQLR